MERLDGEFDNGWDLLTGGWTVQIVKVVERASDQRTDRPAEETEQKLTRRGSREVDKWFPGDPSRRTEISGGNPGRRRSYLIRICDRAMQKQSGGLHLPSLFYRQSATPPAEKILPTNSSNVMRMSRRPNYFCVI